MTSIFQKCPYFLNLESDKKWTNIHLEVTADRWKLAILPIFFARINRNIPSKIFHECVDQYEIERHQQIEEKPNVQHSHVGSRPKIFTHTDK